MSAEELQRILTSPEYLEQQRVQQIRMNKLRAELEAEMAPLIAELREAGFDVSSVWKLKAMGRPYTAAIPILIRHFRLGYRQQISGGISRSLGAKEAAPYWSEIVDLYVHAIDDDGKSGLADALSVLVTLETLPEYLELLADPRNGESRIMFIRKLKRLKDPRAQAALEGLVDDPVLGIEARRTIRGISPNSQ